MAKRIVSVIGGTGAQGGGVVNALLAQGELAVRVATRNPSSDAARALAARGVEVIKGDLLDPGSLGAVFGGAHGAFVVTNFWDPNVGPRETAVGIAAVKAARASGVEHLVWSTLPDCEKISGGRNHVEHFTSKARVDEVVRDAGFSRHTFAQSPMYYQNFTTMMGPQPLPTGGRGWAVPMDPALRVMHMGDVAEVGRAVAAAFSAGDRLADGSYLAVCGGLYSWNDLVSILNGQGHKLEVLQVPAAAYDGFYPGAREMREMFDFFAAHTYFGPQAEPRIGAANALVPGGFTGFAEWARVNMKAA